MSNVATELENEMEFELEHELEHESEHEQEAEHEAFFNHLAAMADRAGRSQALRRIALAAGRSALRANRYSYPVIEGETEAAAEGELEAGGALALSSTPTERAHFAAMMEHTGHAAAEAANEQEAAEHFLPLIPLAAKFIAPKLIGFAAKKLGGKLLGKAGSQLVRRVAPRLLGRVAPRLTRGVANVARTLYRNPTTRPLLHAIPRIARGTMRTVVGRIARGRPVTPQFAVRTLARQTARTLSSPRTLVQAYRRSLAGDRRYHRHMRRFLGRPTGRLVRATSSMGTTGGYQVPVVGASAGPYVAGGAVPTTGGCNCRCVCQPVAAGAPGVAVGIPGAQPSFVPTQTVCPTCGR
jgi:hypothetical protein